MFQYKANLVRANIILLHLGSIFFIKIRMYYKKTDKKELLHEKYITVSAEEALFYKMAEEE